MAKPKTKRKRSANPFVPRTRQIFRHQKDRAAQAGVVLDYDLVAFRTTVAAALEAGDCPYCGRAVTAKTFSADHMTPVARGGTHALANLVVCCRPCNEAKGPLTAEEFNSLRSFLHDAFPTNVAANTLARLRAGGKQARFHAG